MADGAIRTLDLFAGAGGLTSGLQSASERFTVVRAVESDVAAAATFDANHGRGITFPGPIEDWLSTEDVPDVDIVVGGPPCQGFSSLNRAKVGVHRNQLWEEYARTIVKANPRWFVLENVSNFRTSPEYLELKKSTEPGAPLADWELDSRVLLAADFGAAQLRKRTVVIGHHRDVHAPQWPVPTHRRGEYVSVEDAWTGLSAKVSSTELPERDTVYRGQVLPGEFRTDELHLTRRYTQLSLLRFGHIPSGGNRFDLPEDLKSPCWQRHTTGSGDVMGRLRWDHPSVTIRTEFFKPEKGRYLHPDEHRALTHQEAARLQGFKDDYLWVGNKVQIGRQIGNAVPIALGAAIGRTLKAVVDASA